jgi:hypothetical protein
VLANVSATIKGGSEENGVRMLSLIRRQGHVWGRGMGAMLKIQELNLSWSVGEFLVVTIKS